MSFIKSIYIKNNTFYIIGIILFLFITGSFYSFIYILAQFVGIALLTAIIFETIILYRTTNGIEGFRDLPDKLSNGDLNNIYIHLKNNYKFQTHLVVIDELPFQFQVRDTKFKTTVYNKNTRTIKYTLRPTERGEYSFGNINVFTSSILRLIQRRYSLKAAKVVPVYPSYLQLKKYSFLAISNQLKDLGIKQIRKVGHNYEFDQIREFIEGDDYRSINWKATAKTGRYMVNQYQDEKSQHIISVINMGRVMKLPFENLTLLDHAINSTLVMLYTAFIKDDKPGLITFDQNINSVVNAGRSNNQMYRIVETLYNQETDFLEADYEKLFYNLRNIVRQRSLIFLYTNFESLVSLKREINALRNIARHHLLVVVFFRNTELNKLITSNSESLEDIYTKTIAQKFQYEKEQIVLELKKFGIDSILTEPKNLTVDSINKYLEIKSRRLM